MFIIRFKHDKLCCKGVISVVTYCALKDNFEDDTLGSYSSFGIAVYTEENSIKKRIIYIPDVFTEENRAAILVNKCNILSLDPEHLLDVIYDNL